MARVSLDNSVLYTPQHSTMTDSGTKKDLKICIIGDGANGKTAFLYSLMGRGFDTDTYIIGSETFEQNEIVYNFNGKRINLR